MKMETERIVLRPWLDTDAEALYKYASNPEIGMCAGWAPHKSIEESLNVIKTDFNSDTIWAIVLKGTGEAIGAIGYMPNTKVNLSDEDNEPVVGYWVGKPYWNRGICTEALQLMLTHVRETTNYKSLLCGHFLDNARSGRVMMKCGFVPTGKMTCDETLYAGDERPIKIYRLKL